MCKLHTNRPGPGSPSNPHILDIEAARLKQYSLARKTTGFGDIGSCALGIYTIEVRAQNARSGQECSVHVVNNITGREASATLCSCSEEAIENVSIQPGMRGFKVIYDQATFKGPEKVEQEFTYLTKNRIYETDKTITPFR